MYYIYLIVNKVNGKTYVGQHKSSKEWYEDKYMGSGKILKKAKLKYGIENFEKFLIQYCYSKEETNKAERFWIAEYRRRGKAEYNLANGGDGGNGEANKGRAPWSKGKHLSEEHKQKIGESNRGKRHSEEQNRKHSELMKGHTPWNKGKSGYLSEESRKKMSEAKKGRHHSEEWKKRMSETISGKHWKLVDGKRVYYQDMEK